MVNQQVAQPKTERVNTNGEILFISNKNEKTIYVNLPEAPNTFKLIPKQNINDVDLAMRIDEIRTNEDIPTIFEYLENPNNPEQIPKINLKNKLLTYLSKKESGIYAYQVFNVVRIA